MDIAIDKSNGKDFTGFTVIKGCKIIWSSDDSIVDEDLFNIDEKKFIRINI